MRQFHFHMKANPSDLFLAIHNPQADNYDVGWMDGPTFTKVISCSHTMVQQCFSDNTWQMVGSNTNQDALILLENE